MQASRPEQIPNSSSPPHPLDRPLTAAHVVVIVREALLRSGLLNAVNRAPVDELLTELDEPLEQS